MVVDISMMVSCVRGAMASSQGLQLTVAHLRGQRLHVIEHFDPGDPVLPEFEQIHARHGDAPMAAPNAGVSRRDKKSMSIDTHCQAVGVAAPNAMAAQFM